MNIETNDEDLLLAVRYLTDECDLIESHAFEARLADDESAQAALVEATRIVALLKSTPSCPQFVTPDKPQMRRVGTGRWSAILASWFVVGVGLLWIMEPAQRSADVATLNTPPTLAQAWTELDSHEIENSDLDDEISEASDGAAEEVPDWMLAAVMVQESDTDRGENADTEGQL